MRSAFTYILISPSNLVGPRETWKFIIIPLVFCVSRRPRRHRFLRPQVYGSPLFHRISPKKHEAKKLRIAGGGRGGREKT